MGDSDTGIYVADGIREVMVDQLAPAADIVTPNQFELGLLADGEISTFDELAEACAELALKGCTRAVVTGCRLTDVPDDELETVIIDQHGHTRLRSKRLPIRPAGTGDLLTAHIIRALAQRKPLAAAVAGAVRAVDAVLRKTAAEGRTEMAIIEPSCLDHP